jgi:hypothetical protein
MVRKLFEITRPVEKLTVEMAFPEDRPSERQNVSECLSKSVAWCMKGGALSVGLMKAK